MMDRIIDIEQADIDQKATRKRVERVLEMVRMYQSIGSMRKDRGVFAGSKPAPRAADLRSLNEVDTAVDLRSLNGVDTAADLRSLNEVDTAADLRSLNGVDTAADLRSLNGVDTAAALPSLNELDTAAFLANLCVEVEEVVSRLDEQEQQMIRRRYLQKEKVFDFLLFHELNLSERTYRRVKAKAMSKLAYMMRLEVTSRKKTLEGPQQVGR
ncbi:hypothetical protein LOZ80_25210 [Paenibacillus sp. HWE-109]|uniref:ArpU family phage packaging/lysis transcriptional regulator n=1 Tax=Paenibacillus sp. HWE-109 TaxID=1306526 RepID=UPI001EE042A9|nr:ArpU family phage packaging/lysis transcriptional regulator [Paenibacillus sp. HWE-109]UKS24889.1 hypothetical protein LOZ80_25210 [Paenibacillus sp. HWE-109]